MASGNWDDEDYEPSEAAVTTSVGDKWDGEDEDEDGLKDNWDDEEEEDKENENVPKSQPKKKKTLAEKMAEKEEKRKQEMLKRMAEQEAARELTPEEEMAEKLKAQKMQEEADLELAKEAFGVVEAEVLPGQRTIDNFNPSTKEEFTELSKMIVQKLSQLEWRVEYGSFLETTVRDTCAGCEPDVIKKIASTLNSLATEKQKILKEKTKGKKKNPGAANKTLKSGKGMHNDMDYDGGYGYDEYEDFM